jgi:MraZ protein
LVAQATGFVGEYLHTVDLKGRVALPSKYREALGPRFYIARGLDNCLFVYPSEEWALVLEKIKSMPLNHREARDYQRYFLSGATDVEPDRQGRIVLPLSLREYAGITKDVWILGVGTRVEIWDKEVWERKKIDIGKTFSTIAEGITGV